MIARLVGDGFEQGEHLTFGEDAFGELLLEGGPRTAAPALKGRYISQHSSIASIQRSFRPAIKEYVERNAALTWLRLETFEHQHELHSHMFEALRERDPAAATQAVVDHHRALLAHIGLPEADNFCAIFSGRNAFFR